MNVAGKLLYFLSFLIYILLALIPVAYDVSCAGLISWPTIAQLA